MATHIDGQTANSRNGGFDWRSRLDAAGFKLPHMPRRVHEYVSFMGLVTSFCSAVIWLGAAVTGQSSLLGMVLMALLCVGSACAALALFISLRRSQPPAER
jgi:hypothetical protein